MVVLQLQEVGNVGEVGDIGEVKSARERALEAACREAEQGDLLRNASRSPRP